MYGFFYEAANEYILKKLINFVKQNNVQYSLYGFYIVTEKKVNFDSFKFKPGNYYLKYIGRDKTNEGKWLNNDFKSEVEYKPELYRYCFRLKKYKDNYWLYIRDKEYKLYYSLHMLPYFYHKVEKVFFEKQYNLVTFNDNISIHDRFFEQPVSIASMENKYAKYGEDDYISSYDRKDDDFILVNKLIQGVTDFNFDSFYENYFSELTECQQKITALLLLGVRITDVSRLLKTTQVYITLEFHRIAKKIRKIYGKKDIRFFGIYDEEEGEVK